MARRRSSLTDHHPLLVPLVMFAGLLAASAGLLVGSALLAGSSASPMAWLAGLDVGGALDLLSNAAEVVAAVLAVAVTVVAIVVELAANRYSHEITRLFLREPVNLLVLGLLVVTTLQCLWVAAVFDVSQVGTSVPPSGFALTLGMVTLCLLLLVPYIYFVFTFLSPLSVIERICREASHTVMRVRPDNVNRSQVRVEHAVDQLQDVARSAIVHGDRSIAMAAVDAMAELLADYVRLRERLPAAWFRISEDVAADPDFVALAPETLAEVQQQGSWLERKVLRRYLSLMSQSTGQSGDVANVIGINTQRLAVEVGADHPHLLELCLRSFNSYLRTTINARDPRTAYFLMNQYRLLGERLLQRDRQEDAVRVAGYLREYGQLAHRFGLPFLLETAAHDVMQLVEGAVGLDSAARDPLLDCLLQLDLEIREDGEEESLLGVRRAQIQLATFFYHIDDPARAERIIDDLRGERLERLERLRRTLLTEDRAQFWELMDRGVNFAYLAPERRVHLDQIFRRLRGDVPSADAGVGPGAAEAPLSDGS